MIKTHAYSRFVLKSLDEIRDSAEVILQIEKTDSVFEGSKKGVYLCEVVRSAEYNRRETIDRLSEELVRVNGENTKLQRKVDRLVRLLEAAERAAGGAAL